MARGESGRIVIEVDPALKRELYAALAISGSTLKDWFVRSAEDYCTSGVQGSLFATLARRTPQAIDGEPTQVAQTEPAE